MGRKVGMIIAADANDLSPNKRLHWRKRAQLVRLWRHKAAQTWKAGGFPPYTTKVRIDFLIRRGRKIDQAQAHGSLALKAIEDGLVDAGMIPDDSEKWVEWGPVRVQSGSEYRLFPEVMVIVEECDG